MKRLVRFRFYEQVAVLRLHAAEDDVVESPAFQAGFER